MKLSSVAVVAVQQTLVAVVVVILLYLAFLLLAAVGVGATAFLVLAAALAAAVLEERPLTALLLAALEHLGKATMVVSVGTQVVTHTETAAAAVVLALSVRALSQILAALALAVRE
jgi:hypothetical protein